MFLLSEAPLYSASEEFSGTKLALFIHLPRYTLLAVDLTASLVRCSHQIGS